MSSEYFKPVKQYYRIFKIGKSIWGAALMIAPKNSCWYSNTKDSGENSRVDTLFGFLRVYNRVSRNYSYHFNFVRIKLACIRIYKGQ